MVVTKTITSNTELVILDRFWTEEAKATGREPDRIRGLSTLVDELERLLVDIELRARRVATVGKRRSADLEANFQALIAEDSPFTPEQRAKVIELVNARSQGDIAAFIDGTVADLSAQLEPERKHLQDELARISKGGPSNGDMTAEEERLLAELAFAATVVFGPEAGVLVEAVGHLLDWLFG